MAGPVDLKRGRCQSEERPTVGGGPGVGSPAPESGPAGGPGPSLLGARGRDALITRATSTHEPSAVTVEL